MLHGYITYMTQFIRKTPNLWEGQAILLDYTVFFCAMFLKPLDDGLRKNLDCRVCSPSPLYKPFGVWHGLEKIRADMGGVLFGAVCRFCGSLPLFYKMKFDALGFISELVRFKSVSADSSKKSETRACAEFLNSTLRGLGFDSRLLETRSFLRVKIAPQKIRRRACCAMDTTTSNPQSRSTNGERLRLSRP